MRFYKNSGGLFGGPSDFFKNPEEGSTETLQGKSPRTVLQYSALRTFGPMNYPPSWGPGVGNEPMIPLFNPVSDPAVVPSHGRQSISGSVAAPGKTGI